MQQCEISLSNKNAKILEQLIKSGQFRNKDLALGSAIANYLSGLRQQVKVIIDLQPADNGAYKTQKEWIAYFNEIGKPMISAPNIYQAGKIASDEVLNSLRKDFDESWEVSSTRNSFSRGDLSAKIIHNYGSTVVKPKEKAVVEVPVYNEESAVQVVEGDGLPYVQAIFDTRDMPVKILDTLQELCQKAPEDILFHTPDQSSRNSNPKRTVGFNYGGGGFHVGGDGHFDDDIGHSRGVSINPRSGRAKK